MIRAQPSLHAGVWYWPTRDAARDFAATDPLWSRVLEYGRGWAVQAGHSGNYAGPGVEPRPWRGLADFYARRRAERGETTAPLR